MGVQLNIKDPETVRLARALAERSGLTMTETIRVALEREFREREDLLQTRRREIVAATDKFQDLISAEWRGKEMSRLSTDLLHDEDGLPR